MRVKIWGVDFRDGDGTERVRVVAKNPKEAIDKAMAFRASKEGPEKAMHNRLQDVENAIMLEESDC